MRERKKGHTPPDGRVSVSGMFRSWPLLVLAFGFVIVLMIGADIATIERAASLHASIDQVNETYHTSSRALEQFRAGIHLSSLLLRDYLLDPRAERAERYRAQLFALRSEMDKHVLQLEKILPSREMKKIREMNDELNAYWETLDPVFAWTPQEKQAYSFGFLRHRVIPKRESVLRLTKDVETFTDLALREQRSKIAEQEAEFTRFMHRVIAVSLIAGLIVAFASIFRVSQLERRGEKQRLRTLQAEHEMRQLSQQVVRTQEEERRAISRELHDEIGQMLTGLRMEFRTLSKLHGASAAEFQTRIVQGRLLLDQALQSVRDIAMGLRPSMLDDLGLEAALQWQARDFCRRHDIPVNVTVRAALDDLQDRHRTSLYRIVQEALTNCAKHAKAQSVSIEIDREEAGLRLTIQDDGVGLPSGAYGKGLGLVGIQERARELGGSMRVESQPGRGTKVTVMLPTERSAALV